ncbi:MAG TPA: polar localization protein TipN, partial [Caulobacteraceae bacterium]|nr:polar localization protein TipN [Caulobacteraceae bacterium]
MAGPLLAEPDTPTPASTAAAPPTSVAPPPAASPLARAASSAMEPRQVLTRMNEPSASMRGVYITAGLASVLWVGALAAFVFGYATHSSVMQLTPVVLAFLALLALAPMGLIWAGAYVVAQARTLATEAKRSKRLTDELIGPTALAAAQAGNVVEAMRGQISMATEVANQARDHLGALREALAIETEKLAEATAHASRTAVSLVETLSRERGELNTLALTLDARSAAVTDAINRQGQMVTDAADLAETMLREAEAALAARAADLAAAAGEAVDVSRVATEDLGRQVTRLETASGGVGDQMRALEDGLTQQRAALVTVAHALRAEQEDFATLTESRAAQLAEFVTSAQADVTQLNNATSQGASALSELIADAREKLRELSDAAGAERDAFAKSAEGSLMGLSEAGARERQHLEAAMRSTIEALSTAAVEAREAADVHAEAARARVDLLNEAAFVAGQKADQVFESRLGQARGLIEQSARLVEDAGADTAQRLDAQVAAARASLQSLNDMMDEVSARAARLPAETGAKADEIKQAVERGLGELLASARRASEETQAIDAAFQERVKRNYEMLSEAVQLMGVVARGGQGGSVLDRPSAADRARSRVAAALPARDAPALRPAEPAALAPPATPPPALEAAPEPPPQAPFPAAADAGLRGRLKLTPTATDDEFKAAYDAAGGQPPAATDEGGWTWKELLTTLDTEPDAASAAPNPSQVPPVRGVAEPLRGAAIHDDGRLGDDLFREIEAMGIDPGALLPKGRIDEIAAAIQTGDGIGAREVVRTLAPAAIRRIARRLLADPSFRTRVQVLTSRYGEVIADASRRDRQGFQA